MSKPKKFGDIVERIEYLRNLLNLNKSRFSADIGMKPQTYNNFIGSQGSKPNVELIHGIVNRYGANPMWLLNGSGPIFLDESKSAEIMNRGGYRPGLPRLAAVHDNSVAFATPPSPAALDELRTELRAMAPVLQKAESQLRQIEDTRLSVLDRGLALLRRYYEVDPKATIAAMRSVLEKVERDLRDQG